MWIGDYYYKFPTEFPELGTTSVYFVLFVILTGVISQMFNKKVRPYLLLVSNTIFAYSFGAEVLKTLLFVTVITYISSLLIDKFKSKEILFISLFVVIIFLCLHKYLGDYRIVAPLGISFYTFKAISYLADIYKGKITSEINPIIFSDYLMFFPTLTAGPINRFKPFVEELKTYKTFNYKQYIQGISGILFGIFEKIVMCDFVGEISSRLINNVELNGFNVLFGVVLYSFQIYLDFDSYSNIAIGSARVFGFDLDKNFNSPYLASSLKEFWNRWHISLSSWLKDYIYIPLGGNRKGKNRMYLNVIIVFIISGIWHGSTFNFLLWGLLHGLIRVIEEVIKSYFDRFKFRKQIKYIFKPFGIVSNFAIVTFLWLFFKYQNMSEVISVLSRMFTFTKLDLNAAGLTILEIKWLMIILAMVLITDIIRNYINVLEKFANLAFPLRWVLYYALIFIFLIFGQYGGSFDANDFIYRWF